MCFEWKKSGRYIEERIPLKQGLKPVIWDSAAQEWDIEERIPLKQGLKLS